MSGAYYDVAQVCLNGQVVNDTSQENPQMNQDYCSNCGERTITVCCNCSEPVRGFLHIPGVVYSDYARPSFCHNCGEPYPWTERKLEAANELAQELDELTSKEKDRLSGTLPDIVSETPKTTVAATRFKRLVAKVGGMAGEAFKDILSDIASETAKKMIWG